MSFKLGPHDNGFSCGAPLLHPLSLPVNNPCRPIKLIKVKDLFTLLEFALV